MNHSLFITGTDTHVGKTFVSCLILKNFNELGFKTFAMKPVASGCERDKDGKLKNQDALYLQRHASVKKPYDIVNPIRFEKPIAPHIASAEQEIHLSKHVICQAVVNSMQHEADINLIEGVGGWAVPLNNTELFSDVIVELKIPVILVVAIRLG